MKVFEKDGEKIAYLITRKKIKHAYFRVKDGVLDITAGPLFSMHELLAKVDEEFTKFRLLIEHEIRLEVPSDVLNLFGEVYELIVDYNRADYVIDEPSKTIFISSKDRADVKRNILRLELIKKIDDTMVEILPILHQNKILIVPIKVRMLKSKYGSCNLMEKEITINSFLATLDEIYLKYVLLHEFAHLKVPNHSARFYRLLDKMMSNHKQIQKSLKAMPITY